MMTAFLNRHHTYFLKHMLRGDKQTFHFGFNATHTDFHFVRKHPFALGRVAALPSGQEVFCAGTMGQRHPVTGELLFLHRNGAKLNQASDYVPNPSPPRAWTHLAKMPPKVGHDMQFMPCVHGWARLTAAQERWAFIPKDRNTPASLFMPRQPSCYHPGGSDVTVVPAFDEVAVPAVNDRSPSADCGAGARPAHVSARAAAAAVLPELAPRLRRRQGPVLQDHVRLSAHAAAGCIGGSARQAMCGGMDVRVMGSPSAGLDRTALKGTVAGTMSAQCSEPLHIASAHRPGSRAGCWPPQTWLCCMSASGMGNAVPMSS